MISNPKWKSCAPRGVLSSRDHHHSEPTPVSPQRRMNGEWSGNSFLLGFSALANHDSLAQFSVGFQFPS